MRCFLMAVVLAWLPALVAGQSLGEAAAQEKARREKNEKARAKGETPVRVYTNTDLRKPEEGKEQAPASGGPATSAGEAPVSRESMDWSSRNRGKGRRPVASSHESPQAQPEVGAAAAEAVTASGYTADEQEWRRQAAERRQEVATLKTRVATAQSEVNRLLFAVMQSTDTNQIMRLRGEQQQAIEQLEALKKELAEAEKGLEDLGEDARRAGVPSGWVREP
jgi:hypothetical protein